MATGTITIKIGAQESYHVALGLYELKGGARIAPVFDRPLLPERVYRGGPISLQAVISGLQKTNGIGKMLQGVTDAALGVVGTMVQTATLAGPSQLLSSAGGALVGGVRELLNNQTKDFRLFDPTTGVEKAVHPSNLKGPVTYLLLHRGTKLDPKKLKVARENDADIPRYDGKPLEDGVWILLRLRRSSEYPAEPTWLPAVREWIAAVEELADNLSAGSETEASSKAKLAPGGDSGPTLDNRYRELTATIRSDALLTSSEAGSYLGVIRAVRLLALRLVSGGDIEEFGRVMAALRTNTLTDPEVREAIAKAGQEAARARGVPAITRSPTSPAALADASAAPLLAWDDYPRLRALLARPGR